MPSLQPVTSQAIKFDLNKMPALTNTAPTLSGNGVIYPASALANMPQVSKIYVKKLYRKY